LQFGAEALDIKWIWGPFLRRAFSFWLFQKNAFMSGMRAEKSLQCRNLAIDRYDSFYVIICSAFELLMFYKGGAGKDFFRSQACHFSLLITVFGV
jgi:hypothetical protein